MHCDVNGLVDFLKASPSAYHAVAQTAGLLQGYTPLKETDRWTLQPGGKYYVTRNDSSLIAFVMPQGTPEAFRLIAAHSDSPVFRIKEKPELTGGAYVRLNTERYGGMIQATWLDRPLSVAGRLIVRSENGVSVRLVDLGEDCCVIPNVAIHMNREMNTSLSYNPAVDLMPLWGDEHAAGSFMTRVAQTAGVEEKDILGTDLFLYNRVEPSVWGKDGCYISAGRLDDL